MPTWLKLKRFLLLCLMLCIFYGLPQYGFAIFVDDFDDQEEIMFEDPQFSKSPFPTWQQYVDEPPKANDESQQKRPSFLKRLFTKAKKQVSLPIEQTPKIVEGKPRDPLPNLEPILRLPMPIRFGKSILQPGFYTVRLDESQGQQQFKVMQQHQTVLTLPASIKQGGQTASMTQAKGVKATNLMQLEDTLFLHFAEDGQSVVLEYQDTQNGRVLEGLPLQVQH